MHMASLSSVPCTIVDRRNFTQLYPKIRTCLKECNFVAIDLELSGIGEKNQCSIHDLRDRYDYFKELVKTRGILSFGMSIFKYLADDPEHSFDSSQNQSDSESDQPNNFVVRVDTYNFYCNPTGEFITDECAAQFLSEHGFDFERQKNWGIPYVNRSKEGEVDVNCDSPQESASLSNLFNSLIGFKKQIVIHNGFMDLAFLYGSFFEPLPEEVSSFASHLKLLFPSGVYDTKFLSIVAKLTSSYLEYIFYLQQRRNLSHMKNKKRAVVVTFGGEFGNKEFLDLRNMKTQILTWNPSPGKGSNICIHYSNHGWCSMGNECKYSHNIDAILDYESVKHLIADQMTAKKRQQYINKINFLNFLKNLSDQDVSYDVNVPDSSSPSNIQASDIPEAKSETSNAHHSGYDAFMTGYSFSTFVNDMFCYDEKHRKNTLNLVYVSGHKHPFRIEQSEYSKVSSAFKKKLLSIFSSFGRSQS